jgi:CBS domain-containing protein
MTLHEILRGKAECVYTISPDASLEDVVQALVRHNVGSLVVCRGNNPHASGAMVGIITERDILRAVAKHNCPLSLLPVAEAMTCHVVTTTPESTLEDVMGLLTERRIRHLPVIEDNRLAGMISIGDVVKAQYDELSMENHYLRSYLHG